MSTITAERLRELLDYDPETGLFTWRQSGKGRNRDLSAGMIAITSSGPRLVISADKKRYYASVLAWIWMTGCAPGGLVDHIDRDSTNDRWNNLRLATKSSNAWNSRKTRRTSSSGFIGVSKHHTGKWSAKIRHDGCMKSLGLFVDPREAAEAYDSAAREFRGEFAEVNFK